MSRRERLLDQEPTESAGLFQQLHRLQRPLVTDRDLDPLLDRIGEARFVLLGEASHGTADYYEWRTRLSRRLITENGFSFIAVEGDWPDCYRVNRYVKRYPDSGEHAREVLHAFARWPTWMWANEEIVDLAEWLREYNRTQPDGSKVGFYGLDVYSLWDSLHAIVGYLHRTDPEAAAVARRAYRCFEPYGEDAVAYARATAWVPKTCEQEVLALLSELRRKEPQFGHDGRELFFNAQQNALVVHNAESYYRSMIQGDRRSWNIRDRHMAETLDRLMQHHGPKAKAIVWEHNTHIGDARATDMVQDGMVNVGQLVREQHGDDGVVLVGFGSHRGRVIAAEEWELPMQNMPVPPGRPLSWEDVLHRAGAQDKLLIFEGNGRDADELLEPRGHRAIGVVYHPRSEYFGNYVPTILPERYDAFMYLDETGAVHPLHMPVAELEKEVPETYPSGV